MRRTYRHAVMKAKFKAKILPKIVMVLSPVIHKHLGSADLSLMKIVQDGSGAIVNLTSKGIQEIDWLEYIIQSKVSTAINNTISKIVVPIMKDVWKAAGDVEQSLN